MNKFKVSFKITGLELQVEGSRDDVSLITNSIGQQFKGLVEPISSVVMPDTNIKPQLAITEDGKLAELKPKRRKKRTAGVKKEEEAKSIDFKNDPLKYGSPLQSWKTLDKSMWLLYVLRSENNIEELSAGDIATSFNRHFKQQGTVRPSNVARDLGNQKAGSKALLGENVTTNPSMWFLTEEGTKYVQKLIQSLNTDK